MTLTETVVMMDCWPARILMAMFCGGGNMAVLVGISFTPELCWLTEGFSWSDRPLVKGLAEMLGL